MESDSNASSDLLQHIRQIFLQIIAEIVPGIAMMAAKFSTTLSQDLHRVSSIGSGLSQKLNEMENEIKMIMNASTFAGDAETTAQIINLIQGLEARMKNIEDALSRGKGDVKQRVPLDRPITRSFRKEHRIKPMKGLK